jgi:hypothetical protein
MDPTVTPQAVVTDAVPSLAALAHAYPRTSGGLVVALALATVAATIAGYVDVERLEKTHPRWAAVARLAAKLGPVLRGVWPLLIQAALGRVPASPEPWPAPPAPSPPKPAEPTHDA